MKTFTIIEKKWARGGKKGASALQNIEGSRCCLGFLASACGFRRLTNVTMPHELHIGMVMDKPYPRKLVLDKLRGLVRQKDGGGTDLAQDITEINDDNSITDDRRKAKLAPLFAKIGWKPVYK